MKVFKLFLVSIILSVFTGCSSETPKTLEETEKLIIGSWENETKSSIGFDFHSDHNGYMVPGGGKSYRLIWEVNGPGTFSVKSNVRGSVKRFDYQFISLDKFEHISGSNIFFKTSNKDHIGERW